MQRESPEEPECPGTESFSLFFPLSFHNPMYCTCRPYKEQTITTTKTSLQNQAVSKKATQCHRILSIKICFLSQLIGLHGAALFFNQECWLDHPAKTLCTHSKEVHIFGSVLIVLDVICTTVKCASHLQCESSIAVLIRSCWRSSGPVIENRRPFEGVIKSSWRHNIFQQLKAARWFIQQ